MNLPTILLFYHKINNLSSHGTVMTNILLFLYGSVLRHKRKTCPAGQVFFPRCRHQDKSLWIRRDGNDIYILVFAFRIALFHIQVLKEHDMGIVELMQLIGVRNYDPLAVL